MSQPVQASIAVYPLQQEGWEGVDRAVAAARAAGLPLEPGTMQSQVLGAAEHVFAALRAAFEAAAALGPTAMTVTVSNACPLPGASR